MIKIPKTMTTSQAKKYYDKFGAKQDSQGFYEDKPINIAVEKAQFDQATNIFEFGCGTGKRASILFENILSETCTYTGQDLSETMVKLAHQNLSAWKERVTIRQSDGTTTLSEADQSYDRFFSSYVLDLLADDKAAEVVAEAKRILQPGGKICLVGITTGKNIGSKIVSTGWTLLFKIRPSMVGGCRPINLTKIVSEQEWNIEYHQKVTAKFVASEILIATPKK